MKKNLSPLILVFSIIISILILNFSLPKYLPEDEKTSDAAVFELLIETPTGDIIDPTFAYSRVDNNFFFQLDGLVDSAEVLGLDEFAGKTDSELFELDEFFEILGKIDGEWLLVDYSDEVESLIEKLLPYAESTTPLKNGYLPPSYRTYDDFAHDYDMEKFSKIFYNIVNERIIKG